MTDLFLDTKPLDSGATIATSVTAQDDKDLVRACQQGDASAFEKLVTRYQKKVYWIAYNLVGDAEDATDLAQEAFIRVFKSLDRFDQKFNFYTWLYRIVVNLSIDHLRKVKKHEAVSLDDFPVEPEMINDPEKPLKDAELAKQIEQVLALLPEKYRTVIVLRDVHELSCEEIAKIINCTNATTRWRLHKAREMFKERWDRLVGHA